MKIAIGIPCHGDIKRATFFSCIKMQNHMYTREETAELGIEAIQWWYSEGSILPAGRADIVENALEKQADWLFWVDADMEFPPDTLLRLLRHKQGIVGANYVRRKLPCVPVAYKRDREGSNLVWTEEDSTGLEEVDHVGFGCLLTNMNVFKETPRPWFMFGYARDRRRYIGEDVLFFSAAREAGYKAYVDHDLSKEVNHIGDWDYSYQTALASRDDITQE